MKSSIFVFAVVLTLAASQAFAGTEILRGRDASGAACSLEILDIPPLDDYAWGKVRASYSGNMIFELSPFYHNDGRVDRTRLQGHRKLVTASTQMEFDLLYYPEQRLFIYSELRMNSRSGDVFFEVHRECRLVQ